MTTVIIAVVLGAITGVVTTYVLLQFSEPTNNQLMKDFYDTENAVHVSPHSLRKAIQANELSVILVDVRSQQEYEHEHITGAINIPAYRDPDHPAYYDVERIVGAFAALPKDKDIVVYCYSIPCMTGRKIGKMLAEKDIYVKHLGIGWNEWRYFWKTWNHEHEWNSTRVEDYVTKGSVPGMFTAQG